MVRHLDESKIPTAYNLDDIPATTLRAGVSIRSFRSLQQTISITELEPDAETNRHEHPWEQTVFVLDGQVRYEVEDETIMLAAGDIFFLPPGVEHDLEPVDGPCTLLSVWPLREDMAEAVAYQEEFAE